jgi:hypothetical protein
VCRGTRPSRYHSDRAISAPGQPSGAGHLDPLGAEAHGGLDGLLHGATEGHAPLQLLGDLLGHQLRVGFGLAHLFDIEPDLFLGHLAQLGAELLDLGTLLADDDARPGGVNNDADLICLPLDLDPGHARMLQAPLDVAPQPQILVQRVGVALAGVPARAPRLDHAQPKSQGVRLLSHAVLPRPVRVRAADRHGCEARSRPALVPAGRW